MRAALGPTLAHLALLCAGLGLLSGLGVIKATPRQLLAAGGLAYLAGASVVMVVLIGLAVAGVPLSLGLFAAICLVCALGLVVGVRRGWPMEGLRVRQGLRDLDLEGRIVAALIAGMVLFAIVGFATAGLKALVEFDAWQLWTRKAILLFWYPDLPTKVFTSTTAYANVQPDYPLLLPMLEAMQFRAGGRPDPAQAHATTWILFVAGVWALAFLGSRITRPFIAVGIPAGLMVLFSAAALSAYADVPVAVLVAPGMLAIALWLQHGRPVDLALGAILLGGAAAAKNEGIQAAAIVFLVATLVRAWAREWREAAVVAATGIATALVAILPWRAWMAAHDVTATLSLSDGLNPSYLVDRFDRVWPSIERLSGQLTGQPLAQATFAIGIAIAIASIRWLPRLAAFYLAVGFLYCVSIVWAYWISPLDLNFHLATSVERVVYVPALMGAAAVLHLSLAGDAPPKAPDPSSKLLSDRGHT